MIFDVYKGAHYLGIVNEPTRAAAISEAKSLWGKSAQVFPQGHFRDQDERDKVRAGPRLDAAERRRTLH